MAYAFAAALFASAVPMPFGLWARRIRSEVLSERGRVAGLFGMGLFSSLLVLTLSRDVVLLAALAIEPSRRRHRSARARGRGPRGGAALGGAITLLGFVNARRTAAVVRSTCPSPAFRKRLHGFTIAQISDIHVGPTIKRGYLDAIVQAVNRLGADMVAVTGDLVDGSVRRSLRTSRRWNG